PRLGDAVRLGKNGVTASAQNNRKFILLGDPALQLNYPHQRVVTKTVNGFDVAVYTDTLKALEKVTITGEVTDESGVKLTGFNGVVYPAIYDKPILINNLVNDPTFSGVGGYGPSEPFSFYLQKNALYKGKASVVNGEFTFTFIVPKDISYTYGNGKLSYYADNGTDDANGYNTNVIIGGSSDDAAADNVGPDVDVFMNDESFVFGGLTDENPVLLIKLIDSSGINALGNAIGHDITATLDDDQQTMLKLNEYYEADLDKYQSGSVLYPLNDIAEGRHTVTVKAWDVYNNSGDGYTEFVVAETADLALDHVLNYPNPFTDNTSFWFEHNRPGDVLDVKIEIFTVSGKRVKTIQQQVITDGYRVDDITWDGLDDYGDVIGKGVYVYKLSVKAASDNSKASEFQKLVILK
ncbi:MAG TPA: type IX secretion system sortase PorU, partial [Chitinophagales bacterium]|nr:type IX secretion system sortase PorU [Chitinophagales bacterium]